MPNESFVRLFLEVAKRVKSHKYFSKFHVLFLTPSHTQKAWKFSCCRCFREKGIITLHTLLEAPTEVQFPTISSRTLSKIMENLNFLQPFPFLSFPRLMSARLKNDDGNKVKWYDFSSPSLPSPTLSLFLFYDGVHLSKQQ